MPPVVEVELPDGHVVEVEGDDLTMDTALKAAGLHMPGEPRNPEMNVGAAVVRGLSGAGGFFGPVAGAASGALGETMAQGLEVAGGQRKEGMSLAPIGVAAGLGAIPGAPGIARGGKLLRGASQALSSAGIGAGGSIATDIAEGREIDWSNAGTAGGISFLLGGAAGARQLQLKGRMDRAKAAEALEEAGLGGAAPGTVPRGTPPPGERITKDMELQFDLFEPTAKPGGMFEPRVKTPQQQRLTDAAMADGEALAEKLSKTDASVRGRRISRQLAEAFQDGTINPDSLVSVIRKEGMSVDSWVHHYLDTASEAGRSLELLKRVRVMLNKAEGTDPDLRKALDRLSARDVGQFEAFWENLKVPFRKLDDFRRASLVAQVATATRNAISQSGRYTLNAFDLAWQQVLAGDAKMATEELTEAMYAAGRMLTPKAIKKFDRVLEQVDPVNFKRLMDLPAGEVTLTGRYVRAINTANRWQEHYFRRAAFDFTVRRELKAQGFGVEDIHNFDQLARDEQQVVQKAIEHATDEALELTFAATPKRGTPGRKALDVWRTLRPMTTMLNPFPRFFINSYKFLVDHSPAGFIKLMGPGAEQALQDPEQVGKILSRAQMGTALLAGALAVRNQENMRGPKWYQVRLPGSKPNELTDMRTFAPFSTFLFYGEVMRQLAEKGRVDMTAQDWLQGIASINRISGTGLVALDLIHGGSLENMRQLIEDSAAQYIGSFTVPFRTIKDVVASVSDEEAIPRSTRERVPMFGMRVPGAGPPLSNVPGLSQMLPPLASPLRAQPPGNIPVSPLGGAPSPLVRQTTGLSTVDRTAGEQVFDELGLDFRRIVPRSGVREFDRIWTSFMGNLVEEPLNELVQRPEFQGLDSVFKKMELLRLVGAKKKEARTQARMFIMQNPEIGARVMPELIRKEQNPEVRELLDEMGFTESVRQLFQPQAPGQPTGGP